MAGEVLPALAGLAPEALSGVRAAAERVKAEVELLIATIDQAHVEKDLVAMKAEAASLPAAPATPEAIAADLGTHRVSVGADGGAVLQPIAGNHT
jgi:poly-gamma-glutamate capsule biosynthesis protein CapA/YwtB (metallophosphatase superfamily)